MDVRRNKNINRGKKEIKAKSLRKIVIYKRQYSKMDREVKVMCRRDKRDNINKLIEVAEQADHEVTSWAQGQNRSWNLTILQICRLWCLYKKFYQILQNKMYNHHVDILYHIFLL